MVIECAFGRLKGRFGCLCRNIDINLHDLPSVIHACFILHNYCEVNNNPVTPTLVEKAERNDRHFQPATVATWQSNAKSAEEKRVRQIF